jgi:hypothetical protein
MARIESGAPAWRGVLGITLAMATIATAPHAAGQGAAGPAEGIVAVQSTTAASPREQRARPPAAPRPNGPPERRVARRRPAPAAPPRAEAPPPPPPAAGDGQAVMTRAFFVCSFDCPTFLPAGDGPRRKAVARRT